MHKLLGLSIFTFLFSIGNLSAQKDISPALQAVKIGNGIELHYVSKGDGIPVIFIHGSLSDYTYWDNQLDSFSKHYRAIAYSRRYNFPNHNLPQSGYSAMADAEDLAAFIKKLHFGKVHIIGHSYGALTALFLAVRHPELIRSIVLAEPPAMSLLDHLEGNKKSIGINMHKDVLEHLVKPMKVAFEKGDSALGVSIFLNYVLDDPHAWDKFDDAAKKETLRSANEWNVMMKTGTLFPEIDPDAIRKITVPVLMLSGAKSYRFLTLTDEELHLLLPNNYQIIFPDASHGMWYQKPEACRDAVLQFLKGK